MEPHTRVGVSQHHLSVGSFHHESCSRNRVLPPRSRRVQTAVVVCGGWIHPPVAAAWRDRRAAWAGREWSAHLKTTELSEAHEHHLAEEQGEGVRPASTSIKSRRPQFSAQARTHYQEAKKRESPAHAPVRVGARRRHHAGAVPHLQHTTTAHTTPFGYETDPQTPATFACGRSSGVRYGGWCGPG